MMKMHKSRLFIILIIILIFMAIFAMSMGDVKIDFFKTYEIAFLKIKSLLGYSYNFDSTQELIISNIRFPRIVASIFVGAGLAVAGCAYQGIFRNPMADPYILGVSSGATLGATIMIVLNIGFSILGMTMVTFGSFLGALITTLVVYLLASNNKKIDTSNLLLSGVALSFFLSSIVSLIIVFSEENVARIIFWTMGNLSGASYPQLKIIVPSVIIASFLLMFYSRQLDIVSMNEDVAKTLGIDTNSLKKKIMIICSAIVAVCVSFTGIIGFVGLMVPHIMRSIVGPSHKRLLPFSMVGGSIFLLLADTIARSIVDSAELPVGAVTALFGAPFFLWLLIKRKRGN